MKKKDGVKAIALILAAAMLLPGCSGKAAEDVLTAAPADGEYQESADGNRQDAYKGDIGVPNAAADAAAEGADVSNAAAGAEEDSGVSGVQTGAEAAKMGAFDAAAGADIADCYQESCYAYDPDTGYSGAEEYSQWNESGFVSVLQQPLSTFAADVDTASYSNLRRLIREGYSLDELPKGAARIEEMINYFSYDYNEPKRTEPFGVTVQIGACPWNDEARLLMIGLKTEDIDYSDAPASNLVFLLDVSGSMYSEDKLPLLQQSFGLLADNLTEKDRVSIVTYAGDDRIVLDGAHGNQTREIKKALDSLEAGGGTYGSKGIETAYELAQEHFIKGGNNRVILATDGDLNIGLTSEEELEELISEKKESGIFLSVLGFGTGNIKDNKMETLADKGNGNYAYIDCLREANKVLVEEMSATLLTICKDVKFQAEFNPEIVESYRLLGYENRALAAEDFDDDTKDAGEIGAGHSVTALYEIMLTGKGPALTDREIEDLKYKRQYKDQFGQYFGTADTVRWEDLDDEEWLTLSVRYKKPAEDESRLLEYPVKGECYTDDPSDDFVFAAAVAEFGLLASHSEYAGDASLEHVEKALRSIRLDDEYKAEFLELVQMAE